MKKVKKMKQKTEVNMTLVLDNLTSTIERRIKLIEKYSASEDPAKIKIAQALQDNVDALLQVKYEIIALEKHSEERIFGD